MAHKHKNKQTVQYTTAYHYQNICDSLGYTVQLQLAKEIINYALKLRNYII